MAGGGGAPGLTSVVSLRPDMTQPRWLGTLGHCTPPVYSDTLPGGSNALTCTLEQEPTYRSDALSPGRLIYAYRGGSRVWTGTLVEPVYGQGGWSITANGAGNWGSNFAAIYSTWTDQNDAINQAIARGLPWVNPGVPSGVWLGQKFDSGSMTIDALLNLFCTKGGYTWHVGRNQVLSVFPWVTAPVTRILTCSVPVPRSLGATINALTLRYQSAGDTTTGTPAVFSLATATTPTSISIHGRIEAFQDISNGGVMSAGAAQALAANILALYQRVSFTGPFVVRYGEYMTVGGTPVDLGCEQAGQVVRLILTNFGYGGEVVPDPVTFVVGSIEYDDQKLTASIAPFQSLDLSITGLLGTIGLAGGTAAQEQATPSLGG
jgi:hypothetical protein